MYICKDLFSTFLSLAVVLCVFVYIYTVDTACIFISLEAVLHHVCLYTYNVYYSLGHLGVWEELASLRRLFNPLFQFSRLGIQVCFFFRVSI